MYVIIPSGGYSTRLFPLTKDTPKHLLTVGEKTILDHIVEKIDTIPEVKEIIISSNDRFYQKFVDWKNSTSYDKQIIILNDQTKTNETRLGTIGNIAFALKERNITHDDCMVIAGDNLFGFSLQKFVDFFHKKNSSVIALHDLGYKEKVAKKFGVALVEGEKVIDFEEKPEHPKSSLAATACYIFRKEDLSFIHQLAQEGKCDQPGHIIITLLKHAQVHGFVFTQHWFDIGGFEMLEQAEEFYST